MQPSAVAVAVNESELDAVQLWHLIDQLTPVVREAYAELIFNRYKKTLFVTSYYGNAPKLSFVAAGSVESLSHQGSPVFSPVDPGGRAENFRTDAAWTLDGTTQEHRLIAERETFCDETAFTLRVIAHNMSNYGNHSHNKLRSHFAEKAGMAWKDIHPLWKDIYDSVSRFEHHGEIDLPKLRDALKVHCRHLVSMASVVLCEQFDQVWVAVVNKKKPIEWLTKASDNARFASWWAERQCTAFAFAALRDPTICPFLTTVVDKAGRSRPVPFKTAKEREAALFGPSSSVDLMSVLAAQLGSTGDTTYVWNQYETGQARKGLAIDMGAACKSAKSLFDVVCAMAERPPAKTLLDRVNASDDEYESNVSRLQALLSKHKCIGRHFNELKTSRRAESDGDTE